MHHHINIKTKSNVDHVMSVDTYTRWLCLLEAFEHINHAADVRKLDNTAVENLTKPIAINKFINERYHAMLHDVKVEEHVYDIETYLKTKAQRPVSESSLL